jgi:hypothetical protein
MSSSPLGGWWKSIRLINACAVAVARIKTDGPSSDTPRGMDPPEAGRLLHSLHILFDAVRQEAPPRALRHLAEDLLSRFGEANDASDREALPLAFYAACLFLKKTCPYRAYK